MRDDNRIWSLQILRGFAALAVVYVHAVSGPDGRGYFGSGRLDWIGTFGVDLFFVLSGVIMYSVAKGPPTEFMRRRIIRIVPLYFLLSIPWLIIQGVDLERLLTTLTFWPVWSTHPRAPELLVGWSLNFEMIFYVSVACVLARRSALWFLLALYGAFVTAGLFLDLPVFRFIGSFMICEFLFGVGIAHLFRQRKLPKLGWMGIGLALLLLFKLPMSPVMAMTLPTGLPAPYVLMRVICFGAPAAIIVAATIEMTARQSPLTYLGDASYSIYLVHPTVLILLLPFNDLVPTDLAVAIGFALAVGCGLVVHRWVERPILAHLRRTRRLDPHMTAGRLRST